MAVGGVSPGWGARVKVVGGAEVPRAMKWRIWGAIVDVDVCPVDAGRCGTGTILTGDASVFPSSI